MIVRAREESIPLRVLGDGANVLVSDDGFDGVVVRLDEPSFNSVQENDDGIEAGAGVELMPFSRSVSARGWAGLEGVAGIPATLGGAVRTNAGGRFGEFGRAVRSVRLMNHRGEIETWMPDQLGFGYRRSNIDDRIVLSVDLALQREGTRVASVRGTRRSLTTSDVRSPWPTRALAASSRIPPANPQGP
jgi:UDP-N-acetylmuramate dehydrogenase